MGALEGLNDEQREAVTHTTGPLLILAGAGSGKTKVLVHRIAHLIETGEAMPSNILAVTFTTKAAREIKERVSLMVGDDMEGMRIGTFHSICSRLLNRELALPGQGRLSVCPEEAQGTILRGVLGQLRLGPADLSLQAAKSAISDAKNDLIEPEGMVIGNHVQDAIRRVYTAYQRVLAERNLLDFDDLILETSKRLQDLPEARAFLSRRFQYISVDEYQDTNKAQYMLTRLLTSEHRNLCVVGDDDQSIYGWRGADISNILNFQEDYPEAKTIKLERNYRSTATILEAAHAVVSRNTQRTDKRLRTDNKAGQAIIRFEANTAAHEAEWAVKEAIVSLEENETFTYRDVALLYRTNAQATALEWACLRHQLPYTVSTGSPLLERPDIARTLAALQILVNPSNRSAWEKLGSGMRYTLSLPTLREVWSWGAAHDLSPADSLLQAEQAEGITANSAARATKMATEMESLCLWTDGLPVTQVLQQVIDTLGTTTDQEVISGLMGIATRYDDRESYYGLCALVQHLTPLVVTQDAGTTEGDAPLVNGVTLSSLHGVKGLEYQVVFLCGLEEGTLPSAQALKDPALLEEERRLVYVGITRARTKLYLLSARTRLHNGQSQQKEPSRFLSDIPSHLIRTQKVG